jgi:HEAT repeat protein
VRVIWVGVEYAGADDEGHVGFNRLGDLSGGHTVGGTATGGTDSTSIGTTAVFGAGDSTVTKTITTLPDNLVEDDETVARGGREQTRQRAERSEGASANERIVGATARGSNGRVLGAGAVTVWYLRNGSCLRGARPMMRSCIPLLLLCGLPATAAPVPERVPDIVQALKNGKPGERVIAAEMLADLGPKAEAAIPALAGVIRDTPHPVPMPPWSKRTWTREERAAHFLLEATWDALARVGPKAVPAYIDLLAHLDAEVRGRAAAALKALGPLATDAVPALVKRLGEGENQWVFLNAIEALAAIGPKAEAAIPALIQAVLDPKATIPKETLETPTGEGPHYAEPLRLRGAASNALVAIGPKALPAVKRDLLPAIILSLADDGRDKYRNPFGPVDSRSVWTPFGADAAPLVPALVRVLLRNSRDSLIASLFELGPDGHNALAALLADKNGPTRKERFHALLRNDRGASWSEERIAGFSPFVPRLIPFLKDKDHEVRLLALVMIERYAGTIPPEVVKAALPLLEDKEFLKYLDTRGEENRRATTEMIAEWRGPLTIPQLLKDYESDDDARRASALEKLKSPRSGPGAAAVLPILRDEVAGKSKRPDTKPHQAARVVVQLSLDPKDVEQLLVPYWKGKDPKSRELYHFNYLRHLGHPYLNLLFETLNDPNADIRGYAERTIRGVIYNDPVVRVAFDKWLVETRYDGPFAKEYKPTAADALKLFQRGKQFDPVKGIGIVRRIGPAAKDAVPYLLPYLADDLDPVMREAVEKIPDREQLGPVSALHALVAIGPGAKDAVPLIRMQMAHAAEDAKPWYLMCLADIGPGAKAAIPDLKELLLDPDPKLRLLAACALAKIEGDAAPYRATFGRMIHDRRNCVLRRLGYEIERRLVEHIAPDCPELVPVIVRGFVRLPNVDMLLRIAPTGENVFAALIRNAAAAKAAVPDLVQYLKTAGWRAPPEVIELIGAIGPDAKAALPQLRELLDDWDLERAVAAHGAIQKIEAKK